ncbi:MAG: hypothetical protein KH441_05165 [Clostridium sp.]|nr:hypothetical protein [Clostridium sp.]
MNAKRLVITTAIVMGVTNIYSFSSVASPNSDTCFVENLQTNSSDAELFASRSKHYYEDVQTTVSTSYGNVTLKCRLGGNFTYDLNSGKVTSTYGESMDRIEFIPPDLGDGRNPDFWDLKVQNLNFYTNVSGDKVTTTARFKITGMYLEGGMLESNHKFSVDASLSACGYVE